MFDSIFSERAVDYNESKAVSIIVALSIVVYILRKRTFNFSTFVVIRKLKMGNPNHFDH